MTHVLFVPLFCLILCISAKMMSWKWHMEQKKPSTSRVGNRPCVFSCQCPSWSPLSHSLTKLVTIWPVTHRSLWVWLFIRHVFRICKMSIYKRHVLKSDWFSSIYIIQVNGQIQHTEYSININLFSIQTLSISSIAMLNAKLYATKW